MKNTLPCNPLRTYVDIGEIVADQSSRMPDTIIESIKHKDQTTGH